MNHSPLAGFIAPSKHQRYPLARVACQLLEAYGVDLQQDIVADLHLEIQNDPWMPLVITVETEKVTLAHFRDDGVPDPGTLLVALVADWRPRQDVADGQGQLTVQGFQLAIRPNRFVKGRDPEFERIWARNIRKQGFLDAACALGQEPQGG